MNISLGELFLLFLLALGCWYWWVARGYKEFALQAAKRHCKGVALELLDESVVLKQVRVKRNAQGRLSMVRRYSFEFSATGDERYSGEILLWGKRLGEINLQPHRIPQDDILN